MKYLILALGGYLVYEYFYGIPGPVTTTTSPTTPTNTTTTTVQGTQTSTPAPTIDAGQIARDSQLRLANADTWAYYYNQGHTPITSDQMIAIIAALGGDRGKLVSSDAFAAAFAAATNGVATLGLATRQSNIGVRGIGHLIPRQQIAYGSDFQGRPITLIGRRYERLL